jgi:hypothetical protein
MPDPTPPTPPVPTPAKANPPSTFNRAQLEDLDQAEDLVKNARKEPYKTALAGAAIGDAELQHIADLCLTARRRTAAAVRDDTASEADTINASGDERALLVVLHRTQAAAKQKYARRDPVKLQNYFVGDRLNPSEAVLHQNAFSIAELLTPKEGIDLATAPDRLPGIGLELINSLRTMIGLPPAPVPATPPAPGTPVPVPPDAPADRAERDRLIREINDRRIEVQFALDGLCPYTDPASATARRLFELPLSRPFNG